MRKYLGEWNMNWKKVIAFAVLTGVYTAAVNLIPALYQTSFQDIAINPEAWLLFAMLIIMNCETRWEAVTKTFVFFLISQPLIYLIEAVFGPQGFGVFRYYGYWFKITLLTIPGAAIAYQVKRKGILGALALSVAVAFLGVMAVTYYRSLRVEFPHHLLSLIFCLALAVGLIFLCIDTKKMKILSGAILAASILITMAVTKPLLHLALELPEGNWSYVIEDDSVARIEPEDSGNFIIHAGKAGSTWVTFTSDRGEVKEYNVTIFSSGIYLNEVE